MDKPEDSARVLPLWLREPYCLKIGDASDTSQRSLHALADCLPSPLISRLEEDGISHWLLVQKHVIPYLCRVWRSPWRPHDICVSAPTGSGKTLAYVLPVISTLLGDGERRHTRVRCLVIVPTHALASQVTSVFRHYSRRTNLRVHLASAGCALRPDVDIVVTTPGRLHAMLNCVSAASVAGTCDARLPPNCVTTKLTVDGATRLDLSCLQYVIYDEADRLMDMARKSRWMHALDTALACSSSSTSRTAPLTIGSLFECGPTRQHARAHKLLFSATLSQNAERIADMNLFMPRLFTFASTSDGVVSVVSGCTALADVTPEINHTAPPSDRLIHFPGKYTTPAGLRESYMLCSEQLKPLLLYQLLTNTDTTVCQQATRWRRVLVFCNSLRTCHRLFLLLRLLGLQAVEECSSVQHQQQKQQYRATRKRQSHTAGSGQVSAVAVAAAGCDSPLCDADDALVAPLTPRTPKQALRRLADGLTRVLVCTDVVTRGIDLPAVDAVVSYNMARAGCTHVHRVGRTARAGGSGEAVVMLEAGQWTQFVHMLRECDKCVSQFTALNSATWCQQLQNEQCKQKYAQALRTLGRIVAAERKQ